MRKALHVHMLIQLLGFAHPQDIFGNDVLPDIFVRLWYFVASISFRSTEAFARYLNEPSAMEKLQRLTLLPLTPKQRGMIGDQRVRDSISAQVKARGLDGPNAEAQPPKQMTYYTSTAHADRECTSSAWAAHAVEELASGTMSS